MRKSLTPTITGWAAATLLLATFGALRASAQQGAANNSMPPSTASAASPTGASAPAQSASSGVLRTDSEKNSYALGLNIGENLRRQSVEAEPDFLVKGLRDGLSGAKPLMTDDEMKAALTALQTQVRKAQEEKMAQEATTNKTQGDAFLAANKTKPGVVTLPSGLQYKVLTMGTGPKPTANDTVVCNYRGTLIDGKEFDSSYKRGQPATFPVNQVIKGWTEALQLMPVGSKWQLFIPPDMAYGDRGAGPDIGPNATLIFEVELISIKPATAAPAAPPAAKPATPSGSASMPPKG